MKFKMDIFYLFAKKKMMEIRLNKVYFKSRSPFASQIIIEFNIYLFIDQRIVQLIHNSSISNAICNVNIIN